MTSSSLCPHSYYKRNGGHPTERLRAKYKLVQWATYQFNAAPTHTYTSTLWKPQEVSPTLPQGPEDSSGSLPCVLSRLLTPPDKSQTQRMICLSVLFGSQILRPIYYVGH